jgi:hypothetical protein
MTDLYASSQTKAPSSRNKYTDAVTSRIKYADPLNPMEMVNSPHGTMEAWRAASLITGEVGAAQERLKQIRADAANIAAVQGAREQDLVAREQAVAAREARVLDLIGNAAAMCDRVARLFDAEEQREREREEEEPVEDPPGFAEDIIPDEGDLEPIAAKEPEDDPRVTPLPEDDEDAGEVLQRSPAPPAVTELPQERPTEIEDD